MAGNNKMGKKGSRREVEEMGGTLHQLGEEEGREIE